MTDIWYHCQKCGKTVCKDSFPDSSNCPSKSFHYWIALGELGDICYKCKHCRISIMTEKLPASSGCTVNTFHEWFKL